MIAALKTIDDGEDVAVTPVISGREASRINGEAIAILRRLVAWGSRPAPYIGENTFDIVDSAIEFFERHDKAERLSQYVEHL